MHKSIYILLLIALAFVIFVPTKKVRGVETVESETTVIEPLEIIEIPAKIKTEAQKQNYLLVYDAFKDNPRMLKVITCESGFNQFNKYGKPLISPTSDVGIMQINQVHWKRAKALGLDIFNSEEDNIAMAKIIMKEQGINAWVCHGLVY